jgi:hypothetical protein
METWLNLLEETINHFEEGAMSVKAYSSDKTFIITRVKDSNDFWVALEEPGFPKTKTTSLEKYFRDVFGIEAKY